MPHPVHLEPRPLSQKQTICIIFGKDSMASFSVDQVLISIHRGVHVVCDQVGPVDVVFHTEQIR